MPACSPTTWTPGPPPCAVTLGRAHPQSPNSAFIAGYLGAGDAFDTAIAAWSIAHAKQSLADYEALREQVQAGPVAG